MKKILMSCAVISLTFACYVNAAELPAPPNIPEASASTAVAPSDVSVSQKRCPVCFSTLCDRLLCCLKKTQEIVQILLPVVGVAEAGIVLTHPETAAMIDKINGFVSQGREALDALAALAKKCTDDSATLTPEQIALLVTQGLVDATGNFVDPKLKTILPYFLKTQTVRGNTRISTFRTTREFYDNLRRCHSEVTIEYKT
jgi:hypothetical protein